MGYFKNTMYYESDTKEHGGDCKCVECRLESRTSNRKDYSWMGKPFVAHECGICGRESDPGMGWVGGICPNCKTARR